MTRVFAAAISFVALLAVTPGLTVAPAVSAHASQAAAPPPTSQDQQPPIFRGTSDLVRVFATVLDKEGRLVTNLLKDDFEVRDEGKPQPITLFDNSPQPLRLVLMLDVSGSMEGNLQLLRAASDQLFARLLPGDRVRVGTFGNDIVISETFTKDRNEMRRALPTSISPDAPTPLWRAIDEGIAAFKGEGEGDERPVIVVLSDGKDSGPVSFRKGYVSQGEVIDHARNNSVMIYAVGMRSRSSQPTQPAFGITGMQAAMMADLPDPGLAKVAEESGGGYAEIRLRDNLAAEFARVVDELHSQYLLAYAPPKRDGKTHDIEVKVKQSGMKPRSRKTYVAPK